MVWVIPTTWSWTLCTRMRPGSSLRIPIPYLKPCSSSSIQKAKRPGWWLVSLVHVPGTLTSVPALDARKVGGTFFFFGFYHVFFFFWFCYMLFFSLWIVSRGRGNRYFFNMSFFINYIFFLLIFFSLYYYVSALIDACKDGDFFTPCSYLPCLHFLLTK